MYGRYPIAGAYYGRGPSTFETGIAIDICETTVQALNVRRAATLAPPERTARALNVRAAQDHCED